MNKITDDTYKLFIDGKWVDAQDGKTFKAYNPSNGELLATCADAGKEDVDKAVKAAWKAFAKWKDTSPQERSHDFIENCGYHRRQHGASGHG